ncbi:hypothetical protein CLPUN_19930 [Clostridium puniceum]|uniref:Cell wall binding repeat protein n=1 Tax=Clostridium puniceum TaxID=29367 RepID=A0A1S8TKH7_9CLOT|nr:hypothetical protein [Clostridium puniceum]OOM78134.1 hypothetical protein CLPUN_19930 [Clostridium puniceum]
MKNLRRILASLITFISLLGANPVVIHADWKEDNKGKWNTEGSSYSIGWKQIDNTWYYFYPDSNYDIKGYMAHDTIINGYYLNNNGTWSNGGSEIQTYINLLNDTNWQKKNGIIFGNDKSTVDKNIIVDIDQDGVFEMLLHHGTCEANSTISIVTYNNGNIKKIEDIGIPDGGYYGYSNSKRVFFISAGRMGHYFTDGYKLENNECKKVFSSTDDEVYSRDDESLIVIGHNYTVNGQEVSATEYDESFKKFGKIEK